MQPAYKRAGCRGGYYVLLNCRFSLIDWPVQLPKRALRHILATLLHLLTCFGESSTEFAKPLELLGGQEFAKSKLTIEPQACSFNLSILKSFQFFFNNRILDLVTIDRLI